MTARIAPTASSHTIYWLAGTLVVVVLVAAAGAYALASLNHNDLRQLTFLLTTPIAALVGWLVATRRPRNPVGWCILGHAVCFSLGEFFRQYALYGLVTQPNSLPLAMVAASPPYWIWGPGIALGFTLWLLVFPNGQLVSPAWRVVVWYVVIVSTAATILQAVAPGDMETPGVPNPLGIDQLAGDGDGALVVIGWLWLSTALLALASVVVRYRRAGRMERQQIQWPAFAVALALALTVLDRVIPQPFPEGLLVPALGGIWVAIAIAILRHHLFDIDVIINRTIVYVVLSATLIVLYFASVVILQQVFRIVTGQESDLAIVASTLAMAVLFNPLRHHIQAFIDRRFYRQKVDATTILATFGSALRDEVDVGRVTQALLTATDATMRPAHISLWLRTPESSR